MAPERKGEPMSVTAQQYYQRALGLCEKLFDGEIDQAAFEEAMRTMFATQGYTLFTVDKLLNMILKQVSSFFLFLPSLRWIADPVPPFSNRSANRASRTPRLAT